MEWVLPRARLCSHSTGEEFWAETKLGILYSGGSGKWNQKPSLPQSQPLAVTLLVLLPLELIPPRTFLLPFYLVESSGLSFSSRAWVLFPLTALTTLVACPGPLGAEPGWVASSTGTFKAPL